ncbi:hypothetical protein [Longimicrobium sp.]|uniref:hypothetical protein n=1 Tax=Longimicrobium sp. TaxID=2029185 RepID=UPI002CCA93D9|nr:hypothetical protein [Longimicrobium sp.]HSU15374.1 hypothetical protein [Longimicrobium sp.]
MAPPVQVVAFTDRASTRVTYRPGTTDLAGGVGGICISMVLMWLRKSLETGGQVTAQHLRDGLHVATLREGAYLRNARADRRARAAGLPLFGAIRDLFASYGLVMHERHKEDNALHSFFYPVMEMSLAPGHYAFWMTRPGYSGHAMGLVLDEDGPCFWFEPNGGVYRWNDLNELLDWLPDKLDTFSFSAGYRGGAYHFARVTLG